MRKWEWMNGIRYRDGNEPGVYMVKVGREIKIGCSANIGQRLMAFGRGRRLLAKAHIRGAQRRFAVEGRIHDEVGRIAKNSHGEEWYRYRPELVELILPMFSETSVSAYLRERGLAS